jgi:signal transduction histidine kinase
VTFQERGGTLHVATRRVAENEPPPPLARVNLSRGQGYACVEFTDAGPGIPEGDKEKIFRPFFTSRNRGMGLGLAIVKGIIEAHHGAIVEAGEPGAGARFLIFLPLSPDSSGGGVTKQTEERKAT